MDMLTTQVQALTISCKVAPCVTGFSTLLTLLTNFIEDATSFINWNRIDLATGDVLTPIRFYSDEGAACLYNSL